MMCLAIMIRQTLALRRAVSHLDQQERFLRRLLHPLDVSLEADLAEQSVQRLLLSPTQRH